MKGVVFVAYVLCCEGQVDVVWHLFRIVVGGIVVGVGFVGECIGDVPVCGGVNGMFPF